MHHGQTTQQCRHSWRFHINTIQISCHAILCHYGRGFTAENLLRKRNNNCRLPAITVTESSSVISSSDKELHVVRQREFRLLVQELRLYHDHSERSFRCHWV